MLPGWVSRWVGALQDRLPRQVRGMVGSMADRDLLLSASSLAFYGLVSVLPLLLITFAGVEAAVGKEALRRLTEQAAQQGPEGSRQLLRQLLAGGGSMTVVTVLFTIWPATAYGGGLRRALRRPVDDSDDVPGLRGRFIGLGFVLVLPALVLAGLPLMLVLTNLWGSGGIATVLGGVLAFATATVVGTVLTSLIYRAFTPGGLAWLQTIKGAAFTAVVTAVFSLVFVVYVNVGDMEKRFGGGTTAIVVIMGLWLFVANAVLLAGHQAALELDVPSGS